jgi:glycosyltransferase involved in cell wall biosynthesis
VFVDTWIKDGRKNSFFLIKNSEISLRNTLVTTCYNEIANVRNWIDDVTGQTRAADEICIVDAGSTDGTLHVLQEWASKDSRVRVLVSDRCNVAKGRNLAIFESAGEIILSTDMGCRLDKDWMAALLKEIEADDSVQAVAGGYAADRETIRTRTAKIFYFLNSGYKPRLTAGFYPSSRSICYRKSVWERIGGYDETLTFAGDDTLFAQKMYQLGIKIAMASGAVAFWERHASLSGYVKEAGRYGLGNGEAGLCKEEFMRRILPQTLKYPLLLTALVLFSFVRSNRSRILFVMASLLLLSTFWIFAVRLKMVLGRYLRHRLSGSRYTDLLLALIYQDVADMEYSRKYLVGWMKRRRTSAAQSSRGFEDDHSK